MVPKPVTREDMYMSYLINGGGVLPKPITRRDMYLYYLCVNGFGGEGGSDENYNQLKDKLDAMDELITQNAEAIAERLVTNEALNEALSSYVTKAMMSNQQVNDADRVPTSALAYTMAQNIATNANNISRVNSRFVLFEGATAVNSPKNGADISYRVQVENNGTFKMYEISPAGAVSGKTIFDWRTV